VNTENLVRDLRAVILDSEELLKATASQTGERIERVRAKAEESLRSARQRLQIAGDNVNARVQDAAADLDHQVRSSPWATAGVAAGIGLLLGILVSRK
jgi:ElaB/YqjD/DUF883 family membrane-anchored ribosome-binding protein